MAIVLYSPHDKPLWDRIKRDLARLGESAIDAFHTGMRMELDADLPAGQRIVLEDDRRFVRLVVEAE
jgi:hypothetical protein